jgi:hypothetical protein
MDEKEIQIAMHRLRAIEAEAKRRLVEEKEKKVIKSTHPPKMGVFNSKPKPKESRIPKPSENKFLKPKLYCKVITIKGVQCSKYQTEGCNNMCKQHYDNSNKDVVMKEIKKTEDPKPLKKSATKESATKESAIPMEIDEEPKKKQPRKKEPIPAAIKTLVWNKYVGEKVAEAKCMCCRVSSISMRHFHCGHILSEKYGGGTTIDNLRPICANCNLSMNTMNMADFISKFGLHK